MEQTYLKFMQYHNNHNPECRSRREQLRKQENVLFVTPDEFAALLVSRVPLERTKDASAEVVGLRDRRDGFQFFIEAERIA